MTTITTRRQIAAPRERVFAIAADFANLATVIKAIDHAEVLTSGPIGVGTRWRETRTMFGSPASEEMTITAFDPPRSYTAVAESHGSRYETVFTFTENAGGTEVEMRFSAQPLTLMAKVMAFLMRLMIKKLAAMCAQDLDDVAVAAEAQGSR